MPHMYGRAIPLPEPAIEELSQAEQSDQRAQHHNADSGTTPRRSRGISEQPTVTELIRGNSKVWLPCFTQNRVTHDRLFVETVRQKGPAVDLMSAFLQDTDASGPSWQVEQARRFCTESPEVPEARIWLDDRKSSHPIKKQGSNWMTSAEYLKMIPTKQMGSSTDSAVHRRLTFIPSLTSNIIKALMETSTWYEVQTLRSAVRHHIARETSIRVHIPTRGYPIFRLSMHVPYLLLRRSLDNGMEDGHGKKLWNDLSFLPLTLGSDTQPTRYSIYEAMATVVISGTHHYNWHGYAFGNPGLKDAHFEEYKKESDDASDAGDEDDEEDGDPDFFQEEEDIFIVGGGELVANPDYVVWNPRVYFLRAVQSRVSDVVTASEYLVLHLESGVKLRRIQNKEKETFDSASTYVQDDRLRHSLQEIAYMTELFQLLREHFSKITTVWENFYGQRGDIHYFIDLEDNDAMSALHKIEEGFEKMKELELILKRSQYNCEKDAEMLNLQLGHQGHIMNRKNTISQEQSIVLTESAAKSAARSEKAAEETSRATRVNVQLLTITTAVVIALQYFCSDRDLFAFERNARAFWISICVLVPALLMITFALHALDELKELFTKRISGKLKEAATPTPEPTSPA